MSVLVFDIETVPDVASGHRLYGLEGRGDADVAKAMFHLRGQETGNEVLRLHLQRVVATFAVSRSGDTFKVWSLGDIDADEKEILQRFVDATDRHTPTLVSWNGNGFELCVIHYRSLLPGISAPRYWATGEEDPSCKWNNCLSRHHGRHTDVMDVLAAYNPRANAPLDHIAILIGVPGKMGRYGSKVWEHYLQGDIGGILDDCEADVLNTYLVYLRFELIRGRTGEQAFAAELDLMRESLRQEARPHLEAFVNAWRSAQQD